MRLAHLSYFDTRKLTSLASGQYWQGLIVLFIHQPAVLHENFVYSQREYWSDKPLGLFSVSIHLILFQIVIAQY